MFSVVIPLYNKATYIKKAVLSVLNQSFQNFELIIINDGSTDNSLEVVLQINDSRLRIITQQNAGVSVTRNNGVNEAKYDYVAFLDADDWWDSEFLAEMLALIKKYPDAGLWAAKYFKVKNGHNIEANIGFENDGFIDGYIDYFKVYAKTMWMPVYPPSVVMPKKVFLEFGGFKPIIKLGEDFDLWVRVVLKYKIAYLNKPLVYYNQDVELVNKAVVNNKIWSPENHFIFQLDYLANEEQSNPELKKLLDNLRVYTLFRYYLSRAFVNETQAILKKVDFNNQPLIVRLNYLLPVTLMRGLVLFKKQLSLLKNYLIK